MKEQIEEMAKVLRPLTLCYNCRSSLNNDGKRDGGCYTDYECCHNDDILRDCQALYNAGYRKQSEVDLREEITTDDFENLELAKERGWHRKKFYCPNCDLLIKTETWDSKYMFGSGTILKSNEMPKYCPNCGAKMKGGKANA